MVTVSFLFGPAVLVQGIYAKYFGLSLITIAAVKLIGRLFDAVTDPLIGYLSDRYSWRTGSRKPFVVFGGVLFIISSYFLYVPVGFKTPETPVKISDTYFLIWFLIFYLAYTLFDIPHMAWGRQISGQSQDNNKIYTFRAFAASGGMLLFFAVPMLPFFESSSFTPTTLAWATVLAGTLMAPFLYICVKTVPNGAELVHAQPPKTPKQGVGKKFTRLIVGNKPFLIFIGAFFFSGVGLGMWFGMMFLFIDVYLGLGAKLSLVYVLSYALSIAMLSPCYMLAKRIGKKRAWRLGMIVMSLGFLGSGLLSPFGSGWIALLCCLVFIKGGMITTIAMAPALLADIVDYGVLKFGRDYGASYFSAYTFLTKINIGVGGAMGLAIASTLGFDPLVDGADQSSRAVLGLQLSIAWLPALLTAISIAFITWIPIDARRHGIIRRRLIALENRKPKSSVDMQLAADVADRSRQPMSEDVKTS